MTDDTKKSLLEKAYAIYSGCEGMISDFEKVGVYLEDGVGIGGRVFAMQTDAADMITDLVCGTDINSADPDTYEKIFAAIGDSTLDSEKDPGKRLDALVKKIKAIMAESEKDGK